MAVNTPGPTPAAERMRPPSWSSDLGEIRGKYPVATACDRVPWLSSTQPANSVVRDNATYGELTLRPTGYDWEFLPVAGSTFTDTGTASCQ